MNSRICNLLNERMNEPSIQTPSFLRGCTVKMLLWFSNSIKIFDLLEGKEQANKTDRKGQKDKKKGGRAANTRAALGGGRRRRPRPAGVCARAPAGARPLVRVRAPGTRSRESVWRGSSQSSCNSASEATLWGHRPEARHGGRSGRRGTWVTGGNRHWEQSAGSRKPGGVREPTR